MTIENYGQHARCWMFRFALLLLFILPLKNTLILVSDSPLLGPVTIGKMAGILVGLLWVGYILYKSLIALPLPVVYFSIFVFFAGLSGLWAQSPSEYTAQFIQYLFTLGIFVLIWEVNDTRRRISASMMVLIASGWLVSAGVIYNAINNVTYSGITSIRYGGAGLGGNNVANFITLIVPLAWHYKTRTTTCSTRTITAVQSLLLYGFLPVAGVAILLTGSRQGAVAYVVSLLALILLPLLKSVRNQPGDGTIAPTLITGILILLAIALYTDPISGWVGNAFPVIQEPMHRIAELPGVIVGRGLSNRVAPWTSALQNVPDNPVLGTGAGDTGVDNVFISTLSNLGVIGVALYLFPLAVLIRDNIRMFLNGRNNQHVLVILFVWALVANLNMWANSRIAWSILGFLTAYTYLDRPVRTYNHP